MRANIGAGFHFFTNNGFHKSKTVAGVQGHTARYCYVIERYRAAFMGGHQVQWPHSRVVRVNLKNGETDYMTESGKPTSEMVRGKYVDNGEAHHYKTNAKALEAAREFVRVAYLKKPSAVRRCQTDLLKGAIKIVNRKVNGENVSIVFRAETEGA